MTEEQQPDNPWRKSLEGVISGDNFLRRGEIYSLIEYIDGLLKRIEELEAENARLKSIGLFPQPGLTQCDMHDDESN